MRSLSRLRLRPSNDGCQPARRRVRARPRLAVSPPPCSPRFLITGVHLVFMARRVFSHDLLHSCVAQGNACYSSIFDPCPRAGACRSEGRPRSPISGISRQNTSATTVYTIPRSTTCRHYTLAARGSAKATFLSRVHGGAQNCFPPSSVQGRKMNPILDRNLRTVSVSICMPERSLYFRPE